MDLNEEIDDTRDILEESLSLFYAKKDQYFSRMKTQLFNFWIFLNGGPVLFSYSKSLKINSDLMGGFFSAIRAFSLELLNNEISYIAVRDENLIFYSEPSKEYFIVGGVSQNIDVNYAKRQIKRIFQLFDVMYSQYFVNNSKIEIKKFLNFENIVEYYNLHLFEGTNQ